MISIVIVNWNSGPLLEKCIRSTLSHASGCEVIVVDNASSDGSLEFARGIPADISIIRNDRNLGFAAASNLGWRAGSGENVLFLNPDIECLPHSVEILNQTLAANTTVWAVGGHLVSYSGDHQSDFNVRKFPNIRRLAAEMLLLDEIAKLFRRARTVYGVEDVDQPAAACLMVTRKTLEITGGFDEIFRPAWFEDVDLCKRIHDNGGRIMYQPLATFVHQGGYSLERMSRIDFLECFHTNQIRYFRKHFGPRAAGQAKHWIVIGLLLRAMLSLALQFPAISPAKTFLRAAGRIKNLRETEL